MNAKHLGKASCTVTVAGGTGTGTFAASGVINKLVIVSMPANTTVLTVDIVDGDGDGVAGYAAIPVSGLTSVSVSLVEGHCKQTNTLNITGADKDGVYVFKIPYELAYSTNL